MIERFEYIEKELNKIKQRLSLFHLPGHHNQKSHSGGMTGAQAQPQAQERGLKIPPNWNNVWINPDTKAKVQAIGVDAKGRHQYVYNQDFVSKQQVKKFNRVRQFTKDHATITKKIGKDMSVSEEAKVLYVIDKTGFRVGSNADTRATQKAYGVSTLLTDHVRINGNDVTFNFTGKKGVAVSKTITDQTMATIVSKSMYNRPAGGQLFNTTDGRVRDYLGKISGDKYKVKDFRTHKGTAEAYNQVKLLPKVLTQKEAKKATITISKHVAGVLGNTPIVAKQKYIDPVVWDMVEARVR